MLYTSSVLLSICACAGSLKPLAKFLWRLMFSQTMVMLISYRYFAIKETFANVSVLKVCEFSTHKATLVAIAAEYDCQLQKWIV